MNHKPILAVFLALTAHEAQAGALPYPKTGQCAGAYVQSGSYCVPKSEQSAPAIPKVGQCPSGYRSGASSCEKIKTR